MTITAMMIISERLTKTTGIQVRTADIEEMGIKLRLTIVDTPGKRCFLFVVFQL